jgi:hypothetical protein
MPREKRFLSRTEWITRHSDKARLEEIGRKFMEGGLPVSNSAGFTFPLTT